MLCIDDDAAFGDGGCIGSEIELSSPIVSRSLVGSGEDALSCFDSRLGILGCCNRKVLAFGVVDGNGGGAALGICCGSGSADGGTALGALSGGDDFESDMLGIRYCSIDPLDPSGKLENNEAKFGSGGCGACSLCCLG